MDVYTPEKILCVIGRLAIASLALKGRLYTKAEGMIEEAEADLVGLLALHLKEVQDADKC